MQLLGIRPVITKSCRRKYTAGIAFCDLDVREFTFVVGNWAGQFDELITSDLYNLLPNPDRKGEADPDASTISKTSARVSSGFQT